MQRTYSWYIFKINPEKKLQAVEWANQYGYNSEAEAEQAIIDNEMTYSDYFVLKSVEMRP